MIRRLDLPLLLLLGAFAKPALAEVHGSKSTAAEALFQQAVQLMDSGEIAKACARFEASQDLDPALGTQLRLADCYDRAGRTASAWALFLNAASLAERRGEGDRQRMAAERARDAESRLARLTLEVPPRSRIPGLSLRVNGTVIPPVSWNEGVPLDPGTQRVEASAPGHHPWGTEIDLASGPTEMQVKVPALAPEASASPRPTDDAAQDRPSGNVQRLVGFSAGGVALLGFAATGFLSWRAAATYDDSLGHCRPDDPSACTPEGVRLRDRSKVLANASTIAVATSGALLVGSVVLVLTAPSGRPVARVSAALGEDHNGLVVEGAF